MRAQAQRVADELAALATPERAQGASAFFKTGPGEYGEGDRFLGVTVPNVRRVCKGHADLGLLAHEELLDSPWHEHRLASLIVLAHQYDRQVQRRGELYDFYLAHTARINNWDLVDVSADRVVGRHLDVVGPGILDELSASDLLWERRIAMTATFWRIKRGEADDALRIAERLLGDGEPLMHKAVGWMLREVGKRVDALVLLDFLDEHAGAMSATTLSYACEHLTPQQRTAYRAIRRAGASNSS
ncbi:MAG: DNA alkylation repair protein [Solirubrobacteraceae bacterium]|nr:DNA alkylation repair protein [Solirubrobacteraceae bacterium]